MPFQPDSGACDDTSTVAGDHTLRVEPSAIPRLRESFERALDQLRPQVHNAITDLRVRPWAGDPVSDEAAEEFNRSSLDDGQGAYQALRGYQEQLRSAADALHRTQQRYHRSDEDGRSSLHRIR